MATRTTTPEQQRAAQIAKATRIAADHWTGDRQWQPVYNGAGTRIGYSIPSDRDATGDHRYRVTKGQNGWRCECHDFVTRNRECKHILAAQTFVLWKQAGVGRVIAHQPETTKAAA